MNKDESIMKNKTRIIIVGVYVIEIVLAIILLCQRSEKQNLTPEQEKEQTRIEFSKE